MYIQLYPYINFLSSAEAAKTQKPFDTRRQVADRFLNRPLHVFFVASGLYHQAPAERCAWIPTRPWEEEIGDLALNRAVLVWFVKKFIGFLVACRRIQMLMLLVAQSALGQVWCYIRNRVLPAFICQIFWWNRPEGGTRDKQPISKHQLLDGWHRSGVVGLLVVWSTNTIFHKVLMGILLISRPKVTLTIVYTMKHGASGTWLPWRKTPCCRVEGSPKHSWPAIRVLYRFMHDKSFEREAWLGCHPFTKLACRLLCQDISVIAASSWLEDMWWKFSGTQNRGTRAALGASCSQKIMSSCRVDWKLKVW